MHLEVHLCDIAAWMYEFLQMKSFYNEDGPAVEQVAQRVNRAVSISRSFQEKTGEIPELPGLTTQDIQWFYDSIASPGLKRNWAGYLLRSHPACDLLCIMFAFWILQVSPLVSSCQNFDLVAQIHIDCQNC